MPQDLNGWIVVLAALALGYAIGRASGRNAARRDALLGLPGTMPQPPVQASLETLAQVQAALTEGRTLEAIKLMREGTGLGLKEAKDAVEQLAGPR